MNGHLANARTSAKTVYVEALLNGLLAVCFVFLLSMLQRLDPINFARATSEDRFVEYAGALSFVLAGVLLSWLTVKRGPTLQRIIWGMFAFGFLLVGMEEISWGQRILGVSTPTIIRDMNFQGEISIHNLEVLRGSGLEMKAAMLTLVWVGLSMTVSLFKPSSILSRWIDRMGRPFVPLQLVPFFLLPCYYIMMDPHVIKRTEIGEFFGGLAAVLFALHLVIEFRWVSSRSLIRRGFATVSACLVIALCAGVLTSIHDRSAKGRLNNAAIFDYPALGLKSEALRVFEYLEANPSQRRKDARLAHAKLLLDVGQKGEASRLLTLEEREINEQAQDGQRDEAILRDLANVYLLQGRTDLANGNFEEAIQMAQVRIESAENPNSKAMAMWSVAKTLEASGQRDEARLAARAAAELCDNPKTCFHIELWAKRISRLPDASEHPLRR